MAELFDDFEINRKPRWPRLVRALAASLILHGLMVAFVAFAPTVRAAFVLMGMASEADYVDEDYTLGEIRERATIIKFSDPHEKLYYPPGYFEVNSPTAPNAEVVAEARVEPQPTPVRPKPTPTPAATPEPTASPEAVASADQDASPLTPEEQKAQEEKDKRAALDQMAEQNKTKLPPRINGKPFKDLLAKWYERKDELNLNGTVNITLEADREADGTLVNMVMTGGSASDPLMKEIAKDVVAALSASRALAFLEGARHLKMTLTLDQRKLAVVADTSVESADKASAMANVYSLGITYQRYKTSGKDEGEVWKNTRVRSQGNQILISFEMPRETAGTLLAKQVPTTKQQDANK
ncbi:MAG TPA: hypothetical protein VGV59_15530 [Pyrinomonadaceae bacterium]|nr:hypothetical protein [Pyrinomonadaceae bacterium]